MKFYSFHPGKKITCKKNIFSPRDEFHPGNEISSRLHVNTFSTLLFNSYVFYIGSCRFHGLFPNCLLKRNCFYMLSSKIFLSWFSVNKRNIFLTIIFQVTLPRYPVYFTKYNYNYSKHNSGLHLSILHKTDIKIS